MRVCVTAAGNGRQERRGGDTKGQEEHNGKHGRTAVKQGGQNIWGGERPLPAHLQEIIASTNRKLSDIPHTHRRGGAQQSNQDM